MENISNIFNDEVNVDELLDYILECEGELDNEFEK